MSEESRVPVRDIQARTLAYAVRAVRLYQALQESRDGAAWVIGKQFLRSATSIGANIAEAQSAESPADFVHKYGIAQKEARETDYWLSLMEASDLLSEARLAPLRQETNEITVIITTIIVNKKKSMRSNGQP
jgi:four helix bundle protein